MKKWTKALICTKCGKSFTIELGDAIKPNEQKLLANPVCKKCRLKGYFTKG